MKQYKVNNAFETYQMYMGLTLHFAEDTDYSFLQYRGRNFTVEMFNNRNDKHFFEHIFNKYRSETHKFLFYCFIYHRVKHISTLKQNTMYEKEYYKWCGWLDQITSNFKELLSRSRVQFGHDIKKLFDIPEKSAIIVKYPVLYEMKYYEPIIMLNTCYDFLDTWQQEYKDDILVQKKLRRIKLLRSLLSLKPEQIQKIVDIYYD